MAAETQQIHELVEHLFRHRAGQMLASLGRALGPAYLHIAEEAVQDAMLQALRHWPFRGVPDNPAAWLTQVATNNALDTIRRRASLKQKLPQLENRLRSIAHAQSAHCAGADAVVPDDQLAMIFACCHPKIPDDTRIALTLNVVGGFSAAEVARAFLTPEPTVAQRLVRAKRRIRVEEIPLVVPPADELEARLDSALRVIYLLFNEGYSTHHGEDLVRFDLCNEAIRLATLLVARADTALPKVHALLSLMLLQGSRLEARQDDRGELLLLADQDRSLWNQQAIGLGIRHLELSCEGDELTEYHIQAAIAAQHAVAPSYEATNWHGLLELYEQLLEVAPSPVVALNRAVAVAMVRGPAAGLRELTAIAEHGSMAGYYLFAATRADLCLRLGQTADAAVCYQDALRSSCSEPERRFLLRRLEKCTADERRG